MSAKKTLTPRMRKFAFEIALGKRSQKDCAIEAGYAEADAASKASMLLRNPMVQHEVSLRRADFEKEGLRSVAEEYWRLEEKIKLAEEADQHSAAAKYTEMQLKLFGRLTDKVELRVGAIDVRGALEEARARLTKVIDVTPKPAAIEPPREESRAHPTPRCNPVDEPPPLKSQCIVDGCEVQGEHFHEPNRT